MLPALHISASKRLLGRFHSQRGLLAATVLIALVVLATNALLIATTAAGTELSAAQTAALLLFCAVYGFVCLRLVWDDISSVCRRLGRALGCRYSLASCWPALTIGSPALKVPEARTRTLTLTYPKPNPNPNPHPHPRPDPNPNSTPMVVSGEAHRRGRQPRPSP